ncbi:MarR family winged helix-turn-helix transcriptional regulator [Novosphingobium colocasiae]|uniref:MarR family transcriptional regulator n=1 Tax=Novosphingobium colocasiae TaxID=1256513 RepID=A0A918PBC3_9SPHN|nr:MarR family transcriptional regulator [Novosphingobium colocasiae]GGY96389.1 MarR family transcriptional regulator [Novosphingobium colocasiae]
MERKFGPVLGQITRLIRRSFDVRARKIGVTRAQWQVLYHLREHPGVKQSGLAELLEVEPITAGRMIDRMEEAGLVERRPDPADRRAWRLHLTAQGADVMDRLEPLADETIETALNGLPREERDSLFASLQKIRTNLLRDSGAAECD